jgi:hypothetical protein
MTYRANHMCVYIYICMYSNIAYRYRHVHHQKFRRSYSSTLPCPALPCLPHGLPHLASHPPHSVLSLPVSFCFHSTQALLPTGVICILPPKFQPRHLSGTPSKHRPTPPAPQTMPGLPHRRPERRAPTIRTPDISVLLILFLLVPLLSVRTSTSTSTSFFPPSRST